MSDHDCKEYVCPKHPAFPHHQDGAHAPYEVDGCDCASAWTGSEWMAKQLRVLVQDAAGEIDADPSQVLASLVTKLKELATRGER